MAFATSCLIGPCSIKIGNTILSYTLEGTNPSLTITPIIKTFKTDESEEIRKEEKVGEDVVFKCEVPLDIETMQILNFVGDDTSFNDFIEDTFTITAEGVTIEFYRASIKLTVKKSFDYKKVSSLEVVARALRTDTGLMCNITFSE